MDDAVFNSSTISLGAPSNNDAMELDYMDELLLEGCWLDALDGSSGSGGLYDSSYLCLMLEVTNEKSSINLSEKNALQVRGTPELTENSYQVSVFNGQNSANTPRSVMERLIKALCYIQDSSNGKDLLVQIWLPVNRGGSQILTTVDQPFSVNSSSLQLVGYRNISMNYEFAAEEESSVSVGLPGRVFLGKVPEWTPEVRFFRVDEYPRVPYAQQCDVCGTLALLVFEQSSRNCLGVIEIVMTT